MQINGSSSAAPDNKDYRVLAKIKENFFPADPSKLETEGHIVNGIECMSDDTLLVAFMTPPGTKGKILRVDMETGEYAEVPLPDVDGTGMFSRFDGFYKEDETTLWATTNTGNGRVLKIVATDPGWTAIEAVFAREPTSCDTGDNGPTTGVLVRDTFVTSGDKIEAMEKSSLKLVWPSGGGGGRQQQQQREWQRRFHRGRSRRLPARSRGDARSVRCTFRSSYSGGGRVCLAPAPHAPCGRGHAVPRSLGVQTLAIPSLRRWEIQMCYLGIRVRASSLI